MDVFLVLTAVKAYSTRQHLTPLAPHSYIGGQSTIVISSLSPKRDWGPKRVKNLTVQNIRLGFKNLQVSIYAELKEAVRTRNWEVQGGRQVRIWLNALHA